MEDDTVLTPTGVSNIKKEVEDNPGQISIIYFCDKETNTSPSLLQEIRRSTQDKETRISPERIWDMNAPSMEAFRKATRTENENLRKKIKVLQQKVWRKDKKIAIMKTILDELKIENLISD